EARKIIEEMNKDAGTANALAYIRFSLNTKDEFYQGEMDYYDQAGPIFAQIGVQFSTMMLECPYRAELEQKLNPQIFKHYEISKKAFSDAIIEDMQTENATVTEYDKFMGALTIEFEGEQLPLSVVRGKLDDENREVRYKAAVAIGSGLEKHADELDTFYDKLVKIRTTMAKKLGYDNYVELGYYRMARIDYDANAVRVFRDNVKKDIVPAVYALKQNVAKELGIDKVHYYDDDVYVAGAAPNPIGDKEQIFAAASRMYNSMHPELGAFMDSMQANEAFDVDAREGKLGGGYCINIPRYEQPFIFANFNGSSGDIDVMTHEFGHALADYYMTKEGDPELEVGGMETAECHSMSMEFFAWKYIEDFFGENTERYRYKHLLSALTFIPYGTMVDEFQEKVYLSPDLSPKERKELWKSLEEKYRPYMSYEDVPYLREGARWQYQMHIYERPFYYIDYCLAQTVALGFLVASLENYDDALNRYLTFVRTGGQKPFPETVKAASLASPFDVGALERIAKKVTEIAQDIRAKIN
ncbi:MAG: M3 family oligoendopeptidase, partial [Clostridia bacterium]|nr:M3 family oligoendopeptidase [Clostridia bacterium]